MFLVVLALLLTLAASTLPAAAHGGGSVFYCDAGTLNNCTDTTDPASSDDFFKCEGQAGDVVSCTDQTTGEALPYCVFLGQVSGTERDSYLCGPEPTQGEGTHQS